MSRAWSAISAVLAIIVSVLLVLHAIELRSKRAALDQCRTDLAAERDGKWHEYDMQRDAVSGEWAAWWRNIENAESAGEGR